VVEQRGDLHGERWGMSTISAVRPKGKKRRRKSRLTDVTTCRENRGDKELLCGRNWRREGADGSYSGGWRWGSRRGQPPGANGVERRVAGIQRRSSTVARDAAGEQGDCRWASPVCTVTFLIF
jgi:hypothetical protein